MLPNKSPDSAKTVYKALCKVFKHPEHTCIFQDLLKLCNNSDHKMKQSNKEKINTLLNAKGKLDLQTRVIVLACFPNGDTDHLVNPTIVLPQYRPARAALSTQEVGFLSLESIKEELSTDSSRTVTPRSSSLIR